MQRRLSRRAYMSRGHQQGRRLTVDRMPNGVLMSNTKKSMPTAMTSEGSGPTDPATAGAAGHGGQRPTIVWQALSSLLLFAMGAIHLYLVLTGVGGLLGALFVLNAVGALVLAIAIVALRGLPLQVASVLSVLFMAGTLLALVLALTIGLFGIRETLDFHLVRTTLALESVGTIVLLATTVRVFQTGRGTRTQSRGTSPVGREDRVEQG